MNDDMEAKLAEMDRINRLKGPKNPLPAAQYFRPAPLTKEQLEYDAAEADRHERMKRAIALPPKQERNFIEDAREQMQRDKERTADRGDWREARLMRQITKQEALEWYGIDLDKMEYVHKTEYVHFQKADDDTPLDPTALHPKLQAAVNALAKLGFKEDQALHFLLNTAQGKRVAEHHANITKEHSMTQIDIMKTLSLVEEGLLARATNPMIDGGRDFAKLYETDIEFRKQWRDLNDAKQQHYLKSYPGVMSVEVVSTEVGSTLTSDDSYKAADQIKALVEAQRAKAPTLTTEQLYDAVYADPANRTITARAHPGRSSTSGDELQRR
jgi:hypothetical protein